MNIENQIKRLSRKELIDVILRVSRTSAKREVLFAIDQNRQARLRQLTEMEYELLDRQGELMGKYVALLKKYNTDLVKLSQSPDCEHAIDLLHMAGEAGKQAEHIRMQIDREELA